MKRICSLLLCIIVISLMAGCSGQESAPAGAALAAADISLAPGSTGTLSVGIKNAGELNQYGNGKIAGFQFEVKYDPEVISIVSADCAIESAGSSTNSWSFDCSDDEKGSAMIMLYDDSMEGMLADSIPLADIIVMAADGVSGETEIKFDVVTFCDSDSDTEFTDHISSGSAKISFE